MKMTLITKLTIPLLAFSLSACATAHKVNIDAIEANKNKTFTIGIIKVAGRAPFSDNLGSKTNVLQKMPIKEICDVLAANYEINVNTTFDRTIKTVNEKMEGQGKAGSPSPGISVQIFIMSENPYWGNKEYKTSGFLSGMLMGGGPTIIDEDIGDTVNITYSFRSGVGLPWALKDEFYYEIVIKSDAEVLVMHKGIIAKVDMPKKGLILDTEGIWNNFASYAEKIPEALVRDIKAMK